jgi:hypothetical protein
MHLSEKTIRTKLYSEEYKLKSAEKWAAIHGFKFMIFDTPETEKQQLEHKTETKLSTPTLKKKT